jgi:hypothetical protein
MSLKNPVTRPGIDPRTVRLVVQRLNHYATPGPRITIVAVEKQEWYIFWVCVCRLIYPTCNVHAPYYIAICARHVLPYFSHYLIKGVNFRKKMLLNIKWVFWFSLPILLEIFPSIRTTHRCTILYAHRPSCKSKWSKVIPLQAYGAQRALGRLRLPDSVTSALEGGRFSAIRLYPQEYPGTHFKRLSRPRAQGNVGCHGKKSPVTPPGSIPGPSD